MWVRAARNRFLIRSVAAWVALVVCTGAVDWGHLGGDDADCSVVAVSHDHTAHRFSARLSDAPTADHCYICHSLRLLHAALAIRTQRIPVIAERARFFDLSRRVVCSSVSVALPSRAPPLPTL